MVMNEWDVVQSGAQAAEISMTTCHACELYGLTE